MNTWNRFGDKQPHSHRIVWVLTRRMKKPEVREFSLAEDLAHLDWTPGGVCKPDDLWCEPVPPKMPTTRKISVRKPKP